MESAPIQNAEDIKVNLKEAEKQEEQKLMQKYPTHVKPSSFLQKKLNRGQKYFDSGDYNMAMQNGRGVNRLLAQPANNPSAVPQAPLPSGGVLPTVENLHLQQRKASISTSKLVQQSVPSPIASACSTPSGQPRVNIGDLPTSPESATTQ